LDVQATAMRSWTSLGGRILTTEDLVPPLQQEQ